MKKQYNEPSFLRVEIDAADAISTSFVPEEEIGDELINSDDLL